MLADPTGFILPSPARRRAATREGAGKKHLITGVSLLVTRRWQRLPRVSRFRERRVLAFEARAAVLLPGSAGRPRPLKARKCGEAGLPVPSRALAVARAAGLKGLLELEVKVIG